MNVIDIATRRRRPVQPAGTPREEFEALAVRIATQLEHHDSLLVPRTLVEDALADLLSTIERLTRPAHSPNTRSGGHDG